jgi:hypothetical protein
MCSCKVDTQFKGNDVQEKIRRDNLQRIDFGLNFGDILYHCSTCEQLWEENLSEATNKDWPPVLIKISKETASAKYEVFRGN